MKKPMLVPLILMVAIPLIGFGIIYVTRNQIDLTLNDEDRVYFDEQAANNADRSSQAYNTTSTGTLYLNNAADERLTLAVYQDFESAESAELYYELKNGYQNYTDDIDVVFVHLPQTEVNPHAEIAHAIAQAAAEQGMFEEVHNVLFTYQDEWAARFLGGTNSPAAGLKIIERLEKNVSKLDFEQLRRAVESEAVAARLAEDAAQAEQLGITTVPTILLDGTQISARTAEELDAAINLHLAITPNENL